MELTDKRDDLSAILDLHQQYLGLNREEVYEGLWDIFSSDANNQFFNYSGKVLQGADAWYKYEKQFLPFIRFVQPWRTFDQVARVDGDAGWITCYRSCAIEWIGEPPSPIPHGVFYSRSTMIFYREDSGWRIVHAHFSPMSTANRPGDI